VKPRRSWLAALSVAALAVPAAAVAHPGHGHANGHGTHNVQYIFKGTYEGDGVVNVDHGNRHARNAGLVGDDVHVQFDLTNTNLDVAETNTDGVVDVNDIVNGDRVLVQARLPRQDPDPQSIAPRHLVDQTNPAESETETESAA
jgi:hypothetical protein